MHALERRGADDVDPPVVAILEAQNLDPRHQRVADDEMQLAADQLVGALRPHPRRNADFAAPGARRNPPRDRRIVRAADGDAGQVELGPLWPMGSRDEKAHPSPISETTRDGTK